MRLAERLLKIHLQWLNLRKIQRPGRQLQSRFWLKTPYSSAKWWIRLHSNSFSIDSILSLIRLETRQNIQKMIKNKYGEHVLDCLLMGQLVGFLELKMIKWMGHFGNVKSKLQMDEDDMIGGLSLKRSSDYSCATSVTHVMVMAPKQPGSLQGLKG